MRRSAPAGWKTSQTEWDEEAAAPAPPAEGGDGLAAASEAGSSEDDVEAGKLALSTLAMHLPVRLRLMTIVHEQVRRARRCYVPAGV